MPLPTITLVGNLTRDPKLTFTSAGVARLLFSVAANDRKRNPTTKEWEDGEPVYLDVVCWRSTAENAAESLSKGTPVVVTGRLKSRTSTNGDETRTYWEVDADTVAVDLTRVQAKPQRRTTPSTQPGDPWRDQGTSAEDTPF